MDGGSESEPAGGPSQGLSIVASEGLAATVGFELIGPELGENVESALRFALAGGAVFAGGDDPLGIFRAALAASIRDIESHPRGKLFQGFLRKGPYEDVGEIPVGLADHRLSDADTASAVTFVYSHMVNSFKGAIAESLAAGASVRLVQQLQQSGELPDQARLFVGDFVGVRAEKGKGLLKGADQHILIPSREPRAGRRIALAGVTEVKSYSASIDRLRRQLDQHLRRARGGLRVGEVDYPSSAIDVSHGDDGRVLRIAVVPSTWRLPRTFRYEETDAGHRLHVAPGVPPGDTDEITQTGRDTWRIILRWSQEALAEAAFEMTFWYMEKVGEVIYSDSRPTGWEGMSPAEAGRNAAKMMLYYALLRCRSPRVEQRAIALYNTYGFGYAIGMNFRNPAGKREMLWPEDLDAVLSLGQTKSGSKLR